MLPGQAQGHQFPDREDRTWYRTPGPGTGWYLSHRAPVTYNYNPGRGGNPRYLLFLWNPLLFLALRRHIHCHSPTNLGMFMFPKRSILIVPTGSPFTFAQWHTSTTYKLLLGVFRVGGRVEEREKGVRKQVSCHATSCSAAPSGYFQIKKRETERRVV
jgi:hypothetical protein